MALRAEAWKPLIQDRMASMLLIPFLEFAGDDGPVPGTVPVEIPEVEREILLFSLMAALPAIYDYMRNRATRGRPGQKKSAKKKLAKRPAGSSAKAAGTKLAPPRKPAARKPKKLPPL
jgi:hypothetical protein